MDSEAVLPIRTNDTEEDVSETSEIHLKYIGMVHNDVEDEEAKAGSSRPFPGGDTGFLEQFSVQKGLGCFICENEHPAQVFSCGCFQCLFLNAHIQHHLPWLNQDQSGQSSVKDRKADHGWALRQSSQDHLKEYSAH